MAWLEAAVGREAEVEGMDTGASIKGRSQAGGPVTKYKLLPYDERCVFPPPVSLDGRGVLVGLDQESCEFIFPNPRVDLAALPLVGPFIVTAGHPRSYWWVCLAADQEWPVRRAVLLRLVHIIRRLES